MRNAPKIKILVVGLMAAGVLGAFVGTAGGQPTRKTTGAADKITLVIGDTGYIAEGNKPALDAIDKAFMKKYPNVTIKHQGAGFYDYFKRFTANIAAGTGPDVTSMYPGVFAIQYKDGILPLQNLVTKADVKDRPLWGSASLRSPNGNLLAVPSSVYLYTFLQNKKLFAQAGVPLTSTSTFAGLLQACDKFNAAGITPFAAGFKGGVYLEWFVYIWGDQLLSKSESVKWSHLTIKANNPKFVKAVDYVKQMVDHKCFDSNADSQDDVASIDQFYAGKVAMTTTPDSTAKANKSLGAANVNVTLPSLLPDNAWGGPLTDSGPDSAYGITKWSKNPKWAWKWIEFATSKEGASIAFKLNGRPPVNIRVNTSSVPDKPQRQLLALLKNPLNHTIYTSFTPVSLDPLHRLSPDLFRGNASAQSIMDQVEAQIARVRSTMTEK